jgi:SPP1 gp7 family putative phage head morphogenesis protein
MAKTGNEKLEDAVTRHQIYILRVAGGQGNNIVETVEQTDDKVRGILERNLRGTTGENDRKTAIVFSNLEKELAKAKGPAWDKAQANHTKDLNKLARNEAEFMGDAIDETIPVVVSHTMPAAQALRNVVTFGNYDGRTVKEWFDSLKLADFNRVMSTVRAGVVNGETIEQISKNVFETQGNITRNQARAVARTTTNGVANEARNTFFENNADLIEAVVWVSTLDGRTSEICQALDGQQWKPDEKHPVPPAHVNCRSTLAPVIDGFGIVGDRPTVRDTRTRRQREKDFRKDAKAKIGKENWAGMTEKQRRREIAAVRRDWTARNVGSVPARTTYQDWLKQQPADFQDDVLGKTKGKLFRDGDLKLTQFVDESGKTLTIADLRKTNPKAFARADIPAPKPKTPKPPPPKPPKLSTIQDASNELAALGITVDPVGRSLFRFEKGHTVGRKQLLNNMKAIHESTSDFLGRFAGLRARQATYIASRGTDIDGVILKRGKTFNFRGHNAGGLYSEASAIDKNQITLAGGQRLGPSKPPKLGGYSPCEDGLRSVWRHEYGHHVRKQLLTDDERREVTALYRKYHDSGKLPETVSLYGDTNDSEFFSEIFSVYTNPEYGKPGSDKLPDDIEQFLRKVLE